MLALRPAAIAFVLALGLAVARPARGETEEMGRARSLALAAADHLDQKRYAEALNLATQAEDLFHAPTHLRMIAEALEGLGRNAEALDAWERLAAEPLGPNAPAAFQKAQKQAEERARDLFARIPALLVEVQGPSPAAVKATIDGRPLVVGTSALRLDPGAHRVRAEAPAYAPAERSVDLPAHGGVVKLALPLVPLDPRAPTSGGATPVPSNRFPTALPSLALGVGGVGLVGGAVTGVMSLDQVGALNARCVGGVCPPNEQAHIDRARMLGTVSTVSFAIGGAGLVAGVVMLALQRAPDGPEARTGKHVYPWIGPGMAGVEGQF